MFDTSPGSLSRALVFANGDLNDGPAVRAALALAPGAAIIAADGGARLALACGLVPDRVVGDLDSLAPDEVAELAARGVAIERYPAAKDETDLELALIAAAERAACIGIIGAVGDRVDQTLANIGLLVLPQLAGREVRLVSGRQTLWLAGPGMHPVTGAPGDTVSLLPWGGDAAGVWTGGLFYPLRGERLAVGPARGVSNVIESVPAWVELAAGCLLVIHTPGRA